MGAACALSCNANVLFPRCWLVALALGSVIDSHEAAVSAPAQARGPHQIFKHHDADQTTAYGIQLPDGRGPLAFAEVIAEDLAAHLREDPLGPFCSVLESPSEHWIHWGFAADKAEPILKADWHASSLWRQTAEVFVPRSNRLCGLPRAPSRIIAFIEAFRQVNSACWERILDALTELRGRAEEDEDDGLVRSVDIFIGAIERREHFGEIEAQVWRGGDLVMQSHTDGGTALLHLGVTLGGRRTLRVGKFTERHSPYRDQASRRRGQRSGDEVSVWNDAAYHPSELWDVDMVAGSAYLSLPFCFEHGVKYDSRSDDPVIALQCRFAFSNETDALEINGQRTGNMRAIAEVMSYALATAVDHGELRMPSLKETAAMEEYLALTEGLHSATPSDYSTQMHAAGRLNYWLPAWRTPTTAFTATTALCGLLLHRRRARQRRRGISVV